METPPPSKSPTLSLKLQLDWRVISALLLLVILGMLWFWRPWEATPPKKTISVHGEATVDGTPDSYLFSPVFEAGDLKTVTATGNDVVAHLKQLGVKDSELKTNTSAPNPPKPIPLGASGSASSPVIYPIQSGKATYTITVTVKNKDLAQKISDYLATTMATGLVTPESQFSTDTRGALDLKARAKASADAKAKANVMANQLGTKLGRVVSVTEDGTGIEPLETGSSAGGASPTSPGAKIAGPTIEPGTDQVSYAATVVFELK